MKNSMSMSRYFYVVLIGASFLAFSLLAPAPGYGASYIQDVTFETFDQSIWSSGPGFTFEYSDFFGFEWNESISKKKGSSELGGMFWARTNGTVGLDFGVSLDSGSVDVLYPMNVELIYPEEASPGETITISSQYSVDPEAFFATNFPEIQVYADLIFDVYAGIGVKGCLAGKCVSHSPTFDTDSIYNDLNTIASGVGIDLDLDEAFEIVAFNRDGDGELRLLPDLQALGIDLLGGFQFGEPFAPPVVGDYLEVTLWNPDIETTGEQPLGETNAVSLASSGSTDLLYLGIDADGVVTGIADTISKSVGGPPIPQLEDEIDLPLGFSLGYNLLDITLGPDFDIKQSFSFDPDLMIRLDLGTGEIIEFPFGSSVEFVMPSSDLEITPTFSLSDNTFTNDTDLGVGLAGSIDALEASLEIPVLPDLSIGPLFSVPWDTGSLFDVPLFYNSFALSGFSDVTTASFTVTMISDPILDPIPEPGTLILLGTGLLGMFALGQQRWKMRSRKRTPGCQAQRVTGCFWDV